MTDETEIAAEFERLRDENTKLQARVDELISAEHRMAQMTDWEREEQAKREMGRALYTDMARATGLPPLSEDEA
jgi:hypothetical protein